MTTSLIGSIAASSGATVRYDAFLNALYHPWNGTVPLPGNITGSSNTTQPSAFSYLLTSSGPYLRYRVIGCALRFELLTANAGDNLVFTIVPTQATPPGGSIVHHSNMALATQSFGAEDRLTGFGNGGRSMLQAAWATAAVAGVDAKEVLTDDNFAGYYNAAPQSLIGIELWYATTDSSTNAGAIAYKATLSYDVVLEDPAWSSTPDEDLATDDKGQRDIPSSSSLSSSSATSSSSTVRRTVQKR